MFFKNLPEETNQSLELSKHQPENKKYQVKYQVGDVCLFIKEEKNNDMWSFMFGSFSHRLYVTKNSIEVNYGLFLTQKDFDSLNDAMKNGTLSLINKLNSMNLGDGSGDSKKCSACQIAKLLQEEFEKPKADIQHIGISFGNK